VNRSSEKLSIDESSTIPYEDNTQKNLLINFMSVDDELNCAHRLPIN